VSADLKAELQALRETVDKHEKMLRYVMDRYVEKDLRSTPQSQQGGVQASVVNASQSGAPAVAEVKSE
ncbi:RPS2B, partial [Symbiodinium sp. CCMP2456]